MHIISTTSALTDLYESITTAKVSVVAVDTEFFRVDSYWPKLSLIQLAVGDEIYLIDAMAPMMNLTPFGYLLTNPGICKIIHSGRQDFEIFLQVFKDLPINIFDTQVAAYLCGRRDSIGLADLLQDLLGLQVDKSDQYTNWLARPLTKQQLDYAANDVRWLEKAYQLLSTQLQELGRLSWLNEEQEFLLTPTTYHPDVMTLWRKVRFDRKSKPLMRLMLQTLCAWREEEAKRLDWNRGRVVSDKVIIALIESYPATLDDFYEMSLPLSKGQRQQIWHLIDLAKDRPRELWPEIERSKPEIVLDEGQIETLHQTIQEMALRLNVDQRLLISTEEIKSMIYGKPKGRFTKGWRYELFGAELITTFHSKNDEG